MRRLIGETGLSGGQFAGEVNKVAFENGFRLHYQRASVSQWCSGTVPRRPVREFIAEALSRRLGRPVSASDAGLEAGPATPGQDPVTDVLRLLGDEAPYRPTGPGRPAAGTDGARRPWPRPGGKVGKAELALCVELTAHLSRSDHLSGSRDALATLTGFTTTVALPWLSCPSSPATRRRLLVACAHLAALGGFLYVDQGRHGQAQRWYALAMRLAEEGADPPTKAMVLRSLSVQAYRLGHFGHALGLAREAGRVADPAQARLRASVEGQLALALAANGEPLAARLSLREAERALERSSGPVPPLGGYHAASLAFQRAEVRQRLGDTGGALRDLELAVRLRPREELRSQALVLARAGELNLAVGRLDAACASWSRFLDLRRGLGSHRVEEAHRIMRAALAPHRNHGFAHQLLTRDR
ncbi:MULTISPECIES: hypothetical protein [Kitasatospora]|uniref:hypothetical protein n=1 Tax=Kitasatospora TaxID=2063 RepID=UPI000688F3C3|nr:MULTISPECIES: hypothetical protein [Kitasatospora]